MEKDTKKESTKLNKNIAIFGFGEDGKNTANFLKNIKKYKNLEPKKIAIFDENQKKINQNFLDFTGKNFDEKKLKDFDLVFRSPGIHPKKCKNAKKTETSINFFLENFKGKTIGITGSNGKTTTTEIIFDFLKNEFGEKKIYRLGNDSSTNLEILTNKEKNKINKIAVLEISSFMGIDLKSEPNFLIFTNLSKNHLDWHTDFTEYENAKKNIAKKNCFLVSQKMIKNKYAFLEKNKLFFDFEKTKFNIDLKKLKTKTNYKNFALAGLLAIKLKIKNETIIKTFENFKGVKQRLEFIHEKNKIKFYNDSSSTTPKSTILAIKSFEKENEIFLVGGKNKGMDFINLGKTAKKYKTKIILFGEAKEKIKNDFKKANYKNFITFDEKKFSFEKLIKLAIKQNKKNIILSPACASFDIFKNSKQRGKEFDEIVKSL